MYPLLLSLHGLLRWAVLLAALFAIATALSGSGGAKPWGKRARVSGAVYVGLFDLQFLVGIGLYLVSPLVKSVLGNMAVAMKDQ